MGGVFDSDNAQMNCVIFPKVSQVTALPEFGNVKNMEDDTVVTCAHTEYLALIQFISGNDLSTIGSSNYGTFMIVMVVDPRRKTNQ